MPHRDSIIISLGGSLVVPEEIDIDFLKRFKSVVEKFAGFNFFILVGGGKTARKYQAALSEFGSGNAEKDWIGIEATRINARVAKQVFFSSSYDEIITDPNIKIKTNKPIVIGAGWKPGWSTDYCAVLTAKNYKSKTIINLSNIDYVYEKNPKEFPDAKPIKEISWKDFQKIIGSKWTPGLNAPLDPRASVLAARLGLKVIIMNGQKLDNLENFLNNKPFIGTIIE